MQAVFDSQQFDPISDPDQSLYSGGFTNNNDKQLMKKILQADVEQLSQLQNLPFQDKRFNKLLFRYRARNYPQSLGPEEQQCWAEHCRERIHDGISDYLNLDQFQNKVIQLAQKHANDDRKLLLLKKIVDYAQEIA